MIVYVGKGMSIFWCCEMYSTITPFSLYTNVYACKLKAVAVNQIHFCNLHQLIGSCVFM